MGRVLVLYIQVRVCRYLSAFGQKSEAFRRKQPNTPRLMSRAFRGINRRCRYTFMAEQGKRKSPNRTPFQVFDLGFHWCTFRGLALRAKLFEHERHPILSIFSTPLFSAGVVLVPAQKKTPPFGDVFLFGAPIRA